MYSKVIFFKDKEKTFIAWIGTLLKPLHFDEADYIYNEGEEITESYTLNECSFKS
jgi:hypothetical protein